MLVLTRKQNEAVIITVPPSTEPTPIRVVVVNIRGSKVRQGFDAAKEVKIAREEVSDYNAMQGE